MLSSKNFIDSAVISSILWMLWDNVKVNFFAYWYEIVPGQILLPIVIARQVRPAARLEWNILSPPQRRVNKSQGSCLSLLCSTQPVTTPQSLLNHRQESGEPFVPQLAVQIGVQLAVFGIHSHRFLPNPVIWPMRSSSFISQKITFLPASHS